ERVGHGHRRRRREVNELSARTDGQEVGHTTAQPARQNNQLVRSARWSGRKARTETPPWAPRTNTPREGDGMHTASTTLPLAARTDSLVGSVIDSSTSLLAAQTHDIVRFAMGSPAAEAIPTEVLAEVGVEAIGAGRADAFDYAATEGDPALRAALLEMLEGTSDATTPERLTITAGGMQGLDLAFKLFVDPGDLVVVESPTYTNGSATALSYRARLLEVPVDHEGMVVDELRALGERHGRPKVIYTIPTFQNPSGATMSVSRREVLLEL